VAAASPLGASTSPGASVPDGSAWTSTDGRSAAGVATAVTSFGPAATSPRAAISSATSVLVTARADESAGTGDPSALVASVGRTSATSAGAGGSVGSTCPGAVASGVSWLVSAGASTPSRLVSPPSGAVRSGVTASSMTGTSSAAAEDVVVMDASCSPGAMPSRGALGLVASAAPSGDCPGRSSSDVGSPGAPAAGSGARSAAVGVEPRAGSAGALSTGASIGGGGAPS
jgi:hypothetical protein